MNEGHTKLVRDMRAIGDDTFALDENVAAVRLCKAGEDTDESRFAGAVRADKPMHLASKNRQRRTAERLSAAVTLADRSYRDEGGRLRRLCATCQIVHAARWPKSFQGGWMIRQELVNIVFGHENRRNLHGFRRPAR